MIVEANQSTEIQVEGRKFLYFGGTNYLGMSKRAELLAAAQQTFEKFGFSAGAARTTSGDNIVIRGLEHEIASYCRVEAGLVVPAGYLGNTAVAEGLTDDVDAWLIQDSAHSSISLAVMRTTNPLMHYRIDDLNDDFRQSHKLAGKRLGIFCEPIDIISGRLADIQRVVDFAQKGDFVIIDECHTMGVLGQTGRGVLETVDTGGTAAAVIRTGTFSKAFGAYGGLIVGKGASVDKVRARSLVYKGSTPLPPMICAASRKAVQVVKAEPQLLERLNGNIRTLTQALVEMGFDHLAQHNTPIFCLPHNDETAALRQDLLDEEILIPSIANYPTASGMIIGLRWTVQAGHSEDDLQKLLTIIRRHATVS